MNIAFLTDSFLPAKNGVITSILHLKEHLEAEGHTVIIITAATPGCKQKKDVYTFPSIPVYRKLDLRLSLVTVSSLCKILRKNDIEIVHVHSEFSIGRAGVKAARRCHLPVVYSAHTFFMHYKHYLPLGQFITDKKIDRMYTRYTRMMDAVVCPSAKMQDYITSVNPEVRTQVIPNILHRQTLEALNISDELDALKTKINYNSDDFIITYIGRISPEKRIWELVSQIEPLLASNSNLKFVCAGGGTELDRLSDWAKKKKLQVYPLGYVEWNSVMALLHISKIFATLSLSEVHPMTVIEASACGVPVVARKEKSVSGIIQDGINGILLDEDARLPGVIGKLIDNKKEYNRIKLNAAKLSPEVLSNKSVSKLINLYKDLISKEVN